MVIKDTRKIDTNAMNAKQTNANDMGMYPADLNRLPTSKRMEAATRKYADIVKLYADTDQSIHSLALQNGVTPAGLSAHIRKYHRDLLFGRYGIEVTDKDLDTLKVRPPKGQSKKTHIKYKEAIEACGDIAYIEYNVSQVARMFNLNSTALASQLKVYYPEVIPNREKLRKRLGIADNTHRGARRVSEEAYSEALEMYRDTDMTIQEVVDKCGVSKGGLRQFLRFYHKDILAAKSARRVAAKEEKEKQRQSQRGKTKRINKKAAEKYAPAIENLRQKPRPVAKVAAEFGLNPDVFRAYLKLHHPELAAKKSSTSK